MSTVYATLSSFQEAELTAANTINMVFSQHVPHIVITIPSNVYMTRSLAASIADCTKGHLVSAVYFALDSMRKTLENALAVTTTHCSKPYSFPRKFGSMLSLADYTTDLAYILSRLPATHILRTVLEPFHMSMTTATLEPVHHQSWHAMDAILSTLIDDLAKVFVGAHDELEYLCQNLIVPVHDTLLDHVFSTPWRHGMEVQGSLPLMSELIDGYPSDDDEDMHLW